VAWPGSPAALTSLQVSVRASCLIVVMCVRVYTHLLLVKYIVPQPVVYKAPILYLTHRVVTNRRHHGPQHRAADAVEQHLALQHAVAREAGGADAAAPGLDPRRDGRAEEGLLERAAAGYTARYDV
jgi:hypothetical protein